MLIKKAGDIPASEITPESVYNNRRHFLRAGAVGAVGALAGGLWARESLGGTVMPQDELPGVVKSPLSTDEDTNSWEQLTGYNNFYEFGTGKDDPARYAHEMNTDPWSIKVDGNVGKKGDYSVDDLIKPSQLEERIYRFRCVEAWSAVIPWVGVPLKDVLARLQPDSDANYVAFETLHRPDEMRGQRGRALRWPYVEGLRMDEAMHPLTLLAVGLYGRALPNQNGAPIRLVVPWKYGYKSIKSIVRIKLTKDEPPTSWNIANAREYGFYSNVNPEVSHPRWSQEYERPLGGFLKNKKTLMFNGYADQVASMYAGMDLARFH
ncbi:MAG: protein-methionine-sulfoxide reductase catalytic subunit MsrP [Acidobacteria bacterium]|nr:protein-methionine-sulfoxide reductase catalytic subunit MsrP [Acidobacteriota bacterium]